jgi:hypothetical protein
LGHRTASFFYACEVSCRVRAERAKPYAPLERFTPWTLQSVRVPRPPAPPGGSASKAFCCHSAVYASDERLSTLPSIYSPDVEEGCYRQFMTSKTACGWGEDVIPYLPRYKPGLLVANSDTSQIGSDIETAIVDLANRVQAARTYGIKRFAMVAAGVRVVSSSTGPHFRL